MGEWVYSVAGVNHLLEENKRLAAEVARLTADRDALGALLSGGLVDFARARVDPIYHAVVDIWLATARFL